MLEKRTFATFARDESGAVTVDWVVITAGIVGMAIAVMGVVVSSTNNVAADIGASMASEMNAAGYGTGSTYAD